MKRPPYCPNRGDFVYIDQDPSAGFEQAGRHPALVISERIFNISTNYVVCCPITSTIRGYVFEVVIPNNLQIQGVVRSDQIKSLDWKARRCEFVAIAPARLLVDTLYLLSAIIGIPSD